MTKARDTANIVGGGFSGTIAGATMEPTGDTAAGDNAAIGFTSAEGLIITGQGSTNDVTIKNDADADVIEIPTGTVNVTMAGTLGVTGVITGGGVTVGNAVLAEAELEILDGATVTTGELNLIDGGTARGTTAVADGDGVLVNDAGTMRMTTVETLATYMGTKITGGSLVYIASSGAISDGTASVAFTSKMDASKYDHYNFHFQHVIPVTDNVQLLAQTSTNNGTAFSSTNGDYHFNGNTDKTGLPVTSGSVGSDSNEFGVSGRFSLLSPHTTSAYTYAMTEAVYQTNNGHIGVAQTTGLPTTTVSVRLAAEDVDAIKFIFSSGNIESGEIVMYGIANGT